MTSEFEGSATHPRLTTVGAACAIATVVPFVVGIVFTAASGVQVLIPETGKNGLDWIQDVDAGGRSSSAPGSSSWEASSASSA